MIGVGALEVILPFGIVEVWTGLGGPVASEVPRSVVFQVWQKLTAQFLVSAASVHWPNLEGRQFWTVGAFW